LLTTFQTKILSCIKSSKAFRDLQNVIRLYMIQIVEAQVL